MSAHRAIVAAGSPVFHVMLYGNMKESSQKEIELPNIDSSVLKKLFTFFYTGYVRARLLDCMELLQVADYFNVDKLKTICFSMIVKVLDHSNFCDIVNLCVDRQLDSLLEKCVNFMVDNAEKVVNSTGFGSLPLVALATFVKSSDLEVRELNLFFAIIEWCKQQNGTISEDDAKSLFQQIRYPLIQKKDLIEKVHPTNMADPDLYKAALKYHDTAKYDEPEDQLTLREFYLHFCPLVGDLKIEHSAKGTLITSNQEGPGVAMVNVSFIETVKFTFCLKSCNDTPVGERQLLLYNNQTLRNIKSICGIPIGEEVEGNITNTGNCLRAQVGNVTLMIIKYAKEKSCEFAIKLYKGDQVHIMRI